MSLQTFAQRLAAITATLNAIAANARRIFELPVQNTLDPTSLIHVSRDGISESLEIQKIIDSINNGNYSQLLSVGEISVTGLVVSVPSGAQWVYEGVNYQTNAITNITETLCEAGFLRKDILVANQSNQIVLVKGAESQTIRIRPNIPIGTVLVTEIDADDTVVGSPSTPVIGNPSYTKLETDALLKIDTGAESSITTVAFGSIPAGTNIQSRSFNSILIDAMIVYQNPSFTFFSLNQSQLIEVGVALSGSRNFTWSTSNNGNVQTNSVLIRDVTANTILGSGLANDGAETLSIGTIANTIPITQNWRVEAINTNAVGFASGNYTVNSIYPYFFGKTSSVPTVNQALIDSGTKVVALSNGNITVNFNATSEYLWFAIPETSASKTAWYVSALNSGNIGTPSDLFGAFTVLSVDSAIWNDQNYKVYVSNYPTPMASIQLNN